MRKQTRSFTLDDKVVESLKLYAFKQSWSLSYSVEKILKNFLQVEIEGKNPVKKVPLGPYVDTPEDKEAEKNFLEKFGKTKTQEDIDFENSIKEAL